MKKRSIMMVAALLVSTTVTAEEVGVGCDDPVGAPTPPETTTESCASTFDCAWQDLRELFDVNDVR